MKFPEASLEGWRAQVEKELAGVPFDKALVHTTPEGLAIQPLYTATTVRSGQMGTAPFVRGTHPTAQRFAVCMRHDGVDLGTLADDLDGGADALWLRLDGDDDLEGALSRIDLGKTPLVLESAGSPLALRAALMAAAERAGVAPETLRVVLGADPLGGMARGRALRGTLADEMAELVTAAQAFDEECPASQAVLVSTLPYHAAGADAADELALALSTGAAYLGALVDAGFAPEDAAQQLAVQVAIGRDTFGELCKLRALRLVWHKLLAANGAESAPLARLHAVAATRTLSQRDPWVNMLRVSTELFAAILGGADLVTPAGFDDALGPQSAIGRRVARNTGLVLREESHLGRVVDPAGGSYYLETLTDQLARAAWQRFRDLERDGGVAALLGDGRLRARLDAAWNKRRDALAKRKEAITGVSEFANLDEKLPTPTASKRAKAAPGPTPDGVAEAGDATARAQALLAAAQAGARFVDLTRAASRASAGAIVPALPAHRDAEAFEALRDAADRAAARPTVALVTLGPPAEHRGRLGFASAFFAAGGLRSSEVAEPGAGAVACLCGSDERYAAEAADKARALKAAGVDRVFLAGRPGALEAALREAGVDGFIFLGGDVVATLSDLVGTR